MEFFGTSGNDFKDSIFSEHLPLCRLLWFSRGAFKIHLDYNSEEDTKEFSDLLGSNFNGHFTFEIDSEGNYNAEFDITFIQDEATAWQHYVNHTPEPGVPVSRARGMALRVYDLTKTENETLQDKYDFYDEMNFYETPFPCNVNWDKKAWWWLENNIDKLKGKTLFWNIGA